MIAEKHKRISNLAIARLLTEIADRLFHQNANPYRITAYRNAAKMISNLKCDIADLADREHIEDLVAIPTIGKSIANVIIEYVNTGSSQFLKRIKGYHHKENVFDEIPGIGPHLSHLINIKIGIKTIPELQEALRYGRLDNVKGIGPKRKELLELAVKAYEAKLQKRKILSPQNRSTLSKGLPSIKVLLRLDYLYRNKASSNELHKLKPDKNNPNQRSWLPIYHKELNGWHYTCLFSNTEKAHKLDKTKDWVIIYYEKDGMEGQCTVVTEIQGDLVGKRVIRGREQECEKYYEKRLLLS